MWPTTCTATTEATCETVHEFYASDDVSRQAPGRTDFVTIRTEGDKQHVQKRHLLMTIREAHGLFIEEYGDLHKIGKSKFAKKYPFEVRIAFVCLLVQTS